MTRQPTKSQTTFNSSELLLPCSLESLNQLSAKELGRLFMSIFQGAVIYGRIFKAAPNLSEPFITDHKKLWSFKHPGVVATSPIGLSRALDTLHREFRNLSFRITECFVSELENRLGPDERSVNVSIASDSAGNWCVVNNRVPSTEKIAKLEAQDRFQVYFSVTGGEQISIEIANQGGIGNNTSLLHAALALRDQSISGLGQPAAVTTWFRETIGLQDTVYLTALQIREILLEALAIRYPDLSSSDVGLDIPFSAREELARNFKEEVRNIQWSQAVLHVYSPNLKDCGEMPLTKIIEAYCSPCTPYALNTNLEAASILYALSESLPVARLASGEFAWKDILKKASLEIERILPEAANQKIAEIVVLLQHLHGVFSGTLMEGIGGVETVLQLLRDYKERTGSLPTNPSS